MKTELVWSDSIPDHDETKSIVYDIAFAPDNSQLIVAVGTRLLVYQSADGEAIHSLLGHTVFLLLLFFFVSPRNIH